MWIINSLFKKDILGRHKNLLIIGGGVLQHETLIQCAHLGLGKVLVDGDIECYCNRSPHFNSNYFIHADIKKPKLVLSQVKDFLNKNKKVKIVGVYTQGTDVEYTVAYVAEGLGLPSIGSDVAYKCNNKIATRNALKIAGISQPRFYVATNPNEAIRFANRVAYPCIIKAVDNCGSRGVTIVHRDSEVLSACESALKNSIDKRILIEEFIDGDEYSIDTIVYKNRVYPAGISDRIFETKDNYAIQNGSMTPSLLPEETQQRMYWVMEDCAEALGVKWGAFKGDLILSKDKIYVLEVTARLSGGFDAQFRKPYSYGVNLIKATIDMACGKPLDFKDIIPKWVKWSQTFSVFPKPGVIKEIRGLTELKSIPAVKNIFITKKVGDRIDFKNCADRVVYIIVCRDTYDDLLNTVEKAKETIQFIME